jgi:methionine biosynthesis protein MetW
MSESSVKKFENNRWGSGDQTPGFRHAEAHTMIEDAKSVLDVGCGDGLFLSSLQTKGIKVAGIDISEEGVKKCQEKGIDARVHDIALEKLPYPDASFDTVVMLDILEHVYAPEVLLEEAIRVSKNHVILGVPNFSSLPARLQVLRGKVPENNLPHKGHIYWFNYPVLMKLLKSHDLKVEKMSYNTIWEKKPIIGGIMKKLCVIFPNLFALSFVVKVTIK